MSFPESDWKTFVEVKKVALERFCQRVLGECRGILDEGGISAHQRYLRVFELMRERDAELARAFDDHRRSTALGHLVVMRKLGVLRDEEMAGFSSETRDRIESAARL